MKLPRRRKATEKKSGNAETNGVGEKSANVRSATAVHRTRITPGTVIEFDTGSGVVRSTVCGVPHCGKQIGASPQNEATFEWYAYDWEEHRWFGPFPPGLYYCGSHYPKSQDEIRRTYGEPS